MLSDPAPQAHRKHTAPGSVALCFVILDAPIESSPARHRRISGETLADVTMLSRWCRTAIITIARLDVALQST
jgi:hypothetical protein